MKRLLMAIDMQEGWRHPTATDPIMEDVAQLCKDFDGDVIHCCFRNEPDSLFYSQLRWDRFTEPHDTDPISAMAVLGLATYWRSTYSCITQETHSVVQTYDHVYLAGIFTDVSVAATAMHLFDLNIPVSVVADCVGTLHGEEVQMAAIKSLGSILGYTNLVTADTLRKPSS